MNVSRVSRQASETQWRQVVLLGCSVLFFYLTLIAISAIEAKPSKSPAKDTVDLYHAYFRKVAPEDPGTVHLLISNNTADTVMVDKIYLNGYEMKDMPNDLAIWYQAVPCITRPGEVTDVMVKLRRPTAKPVRLSVGLSNGQEISTVLETVSPSLKFNFIGYSNEMDRAYIYLENTGTESLKVKNIYCNSEDVTDRCFIPEPVIAPSSKIFSVFPARVPFVWGQYLAFKIQTDNGTTASAVSRAYTHFPIASFGQDTRTEYGFDRDYFAVPYSQSGMDFSGLRSRSARNAYHLEEDPVCKDGLAHLLMGSTAATVINNNKVCYINDPVHPGLIYACEHHKPYCYYIYGEVADILAVDPYEMYFYSNQPLKNAEYVAQAKTAAEPRPLWTIPEAFTHSENPRHPAPEEERIIIYSEIGEGSKGIWYYHYSKSNKSGYNGSPILEKEIGRINKELRQLRDYIVISEPFPLAKSDDGRIKTYSLLCGHKGIVLLLINKEHESLFGEKGKQFRYTSLGSFKVRCKVPKWLKVNRVSEINEDKTVDMGYVLLEDEIVIPVVGLGVTKQILVQTERRM